MMQDGGHEKCKLFYLSFIIILLLLPINLSSCKENKAPPDNPAFINSEYNNIISDKWMGIYFKGSKLGFTNSVIFEGKDGYKIISKAIIKMKALGEVQETSFSQECYLTKDLKTKGFESLNQIAGHRQKISGVVKGDKLHMEIASAGAVSKRTIDFDNDTHLAGALELVITKLGLTSPDPSTGLVPRPPSEGGERGGGLKVGNKYNIKIFMEPIQAIVPLQIEIKRKEKIKISPSPSTGEGQGEEIEKDAYYLEEKFKELSAGIWVTEDGEVIKEVSLEGLESRKEDKDTALKFDREIIPVSSLITFSLIKPNKDIKEPHNIKRLRLKLKNISNPNIIIEDQRQKVLSKNQAGKFYDVEMEVKNQKSEVRSQKLEEKNLEKYLEETPEIQSDNPEIKKKAEEIAGGETDVLSKALKINKWVYDYLDKKPVDTFSAVDALKSKEGECQSHSNLFAALSRASGISTKIVAGIVYSEDYNGFLYHAWPEVYIGSTGSSGEWLALDPTLGEKEADATHIKLVEGGWEEQLKLLHYIGKVGIEIIEVN
ncbi:MAG: transglutaminase domain-containing protein [Nitrospinae bacterium]|nr:transglutaminase domain-containing protein [Nitrospinota bacterium]